MRGKWKQRILAAILSIIMCFSGVAGDYIFAAGTESSAAENGNSETFSGEGEGTQENPYIITNAQQMDEVRYNLSACYVLGNDIDLSMIPSWIPIGDDSGTFWGNFDGNDKTISNIKINKGNLKYYGLFGRYGGGRLENIKLENVDIDVTITEPIYNVFVGSVIANSNNGMNEGATEIDNCSASGNINISNVCDKNIALSVNGIGSGIKFSNCENSVDITINSDYGNVNAGGIGSAKIFLNCINYGNITANVLEENSCVGGITGRIYVYRSSGSFEKYANYGDIKCTTLEDRTYPGWGYDYGCCVGGIVGHSTRNITDCVNYGSIRGYAKQAVVGGSNSNHNSYSYVGGIAGIVEDEDHIAGKSPIVNNCYNEGEIIQSVGQKNENGTFVDTYNPVGRIVAVCGKIEGCYSIDTTTCNGTIPTDNIGVDKLNGASLDLESIEAMIQNLNIGTSTPDPEPSIPEDDISGKVDRLTLEDAAGTPDSPLSSRGHIYLNAGETATLEQWEQLLEKISWESSNPNVADVTLCIPETDDSQGTYGDIDIRINITVKEPGTTTLTGSLPNGITESFQVSVSDISYGVVIDESKTEMEGKTVAVSGTLTLAESAEASKENLQSAVDSLVISSSDEEIAKSLACNSTPNVDNRSAALEIWITLYNAGTTDISISNSDGSVSACKVTVTEDTSEDDTGDDADYTEEMHRLLFDRGTHDVLTYLCMDKNFTASQFIASNDDSYGMQIQFITDLMYRQWDGWKDLLTSETSVEEAEKILVSLLQSYEDKIKIASESKTAIKVANKISEAFSNYLECSGLIKVMKSEELKTAKEYFSTDKVARLLVDGKFDELTIHINQILAPTLESPKAWNDLMSGFIQSAELSKAAKNGITKKVAGLKIGGGLDDLKGGMKAITGAADVINYMYQLEALLTSDEIYSEMLAYVRDNCVFPVVQQAAASLYATINNGVAGVVSDLMQKLVNKGAEKFVEAAFDAACKECTPFAIIKAGYDWGITISEFFFKTGTAQELTDSLRSQVYIASCLGEWAVDNRLNYLTSVGTDKENEYAKASYYSMYVLWESRKNAEETLRKILDAYRFQKHSKKYKLSKDITNTLESYEDLYFSKEKLGKLLGISVSCPVDLEVYDENGIKLLTVVDGAECQGCENDIYYYCSYNPFAEDYEKYIYYDENANYSIKLVGNDLGLVDCSVSMIDSEGFVSEHYFENLETGNGTVIDLSNISENGADYKVTNRDGSIVTNSMEKRKTEYVSTSVINLNDTSVTMKVGDKKLLTASVVPTNATNQKLFWESGNDKVVTVNSDGVITAVANGTATVTASQGDLSQTCKIIVGAQNSGSTTPSGGYIPGGYTSSSSGTGTTPTGGDAGTPSTGGNAGIPSTGGNAEIPSGIDAGDTSTSGSTETPSTDDSENKLIAKKVKLSKTSTSVTKYLIVSRRIFFRECMAKTGGVPGYIEDFCHVLSEK